MVVVASVTMERAASALGSRFAVPEIVVGGLVLAAVTSLPNAVAAVYLAARGRGAATLSTALNSNTLNVVLGLLLPAAVIGLGRPTTQTTLIAAWYIGLTAVVLAFAYRDRGIRREIGVLVIAAYLVFVGTLLVSAYGVWPQSRIAIVTGVAVTAVLFGVRLALGHHARSGDSKPRPPPLLLAGGRAIDQHLANTSPDASGNGRGPVSERSGIPPRPRSPLARASLLPGWSVKRLWVLGLALSCVVAATDAVLGARIVLIGLLIVGPCCVLLTGRWVPTGLTGLWVIGLAVVLGFPDGIWGTSTHLAFLGAVVLVAFANTLAAAFIGRFRSLRPR